MSYTVIGDTVNTAARLCQKAEAGQILTTTPVIQSLGERLQGESLGEVTLKGKSKPTPLFRVTGLT